MARRRRVWLALSQEGTTDGSDTTTGDIGLRDSLMADSDDVNQFRNFIFELSFLNDSTF